MTAKQSEFERELRESLRLGDVLLILSVNAILIGVFYLPETLARQGILRLDYPTIWSLFTTHYWHRSPRHLVENISAYVLVSLTTYVLAVLSDWRTYFLSAFVIILTAFPVVLSTGYLAVLSRASVLGFSALTMAFVGLVPMFLLRFLRVQYSTGIRYGHAVGVFLIGGALQFSGLVRMNTLAVGAIVGGMLFVYVLAVIRWSRLSSQLSLEVLTDKSGYFELTILSLVVFVVTLLLASPESAVIVFIHGTGYVLGFVVPFVLIRTIPSS